MKLIGYWKYCCLTLVLVSMLNSCNTSEKKTGSLIDLNLSEKMSTQDTIVMSDILSDINYLPLETREGSHLDLVERIIPITSGYLIQTYKSKLKLFDLNGKYLRDIGRIGKGPGEYVSIEDLYWDDKTQEIIVFNLQVGNLIFYSENGKFLRSVELPYPAQFLHRLANGSFLGITFLPVQMGTEFGKHFIFTKEGETISFWTESDKGNIRIPRLTIVPEFCRIGNQDIFLPVNSDTLYLIDNNNMKPLGVLGLSDLIIPENIYFNQQPSSSEWNKYVTNIDLKSFDEDHFIAAFDFKRISYSAICNIHNGTVRFVSKPMDDLKLLTNDMDGGLPIIGFSHMSIYNGKMLQAVDAVNLIGLLENNMFPGLSQKFKDLVISLDENGNPLLMCYDVK